MTGHIFIEGEIGSDVTVKSVRADIANYPQASEWMVHINSGGGDVYEGYQIGSILRNLSKTTAYIGSMCASIATCCAISCQRRIMSPQGDFMIHLPTGTISGTAEDLRKGALQLDRIKSELISLYAPKVALKGVTTDQLSAMIEKETSMSPAEALAMGFIDEVQDKLKAVAKLDTTKFNMENTLTREEAEGLFKKMGDRMDKFFASFKIKNSVQIALADGSMATSDAATPEELVGSSIVGADGNPLPDGPAETADGYQITVAAGKVTEYQPLMADNKDQVAQLQQQVADLTAQLATKSNEATQAVQATAKLETKFSNEFKALKQELEEMKSKTFGDDTPPAKDPNFKNDKGQATKSHDPMIDMWNAYTTSRPGGIA